MSCLTTPVHRVQSRHESRTSCIHWPGGCDCSLLYSVSVPAWMASFNNRCTDVAGCVVVGYRTDFHSGNFADPISRISVPGHHHFDRCRDGVRQSAGPADVRRVSVVCCDGEKWGSPANGFDDGESLRCQQRTAACARLHGSLRFFKHVDL